MGTFDELSESGVDFASLLKRSESDKSITDIEPHSVSPQANHTFMRSISHTRSIPESGDKIAHDKSRSPLVCDLDYLSKSLDTGSVLGHRKRPKPETEANAHDAVDEPLLTTHKSLTTLTKRHSGKRSHVPVVNFSNNSQTKPPQSIALQRLISQESAGRVSLTRSMECVADGVMGSVMSLGSLEPDIQPDHVAKVQEEEKRAAGTIEVKYYFKYFISGGGVFGLIALILANVLAQGAFIASDWWLSYWVTKEEVYSTEFEEQQQLIESWERNVTRTNSSQSNSTITDDIEVEPISEVPRNLYIYIYTAITLSVFVFGLIRALLIFKILIRASRVLHNKMFNAVVRCPILFFDTNPVGRILNRFSKDIGLLDENLPLVMFDFIQCGLMILGYVLVCGVINPWVFIPTTPLIVAFVYIRKYYLATSRDVKRLEGTTRSPVYSHVSASMNGLQTIRAYQVQPTFVKEFNKHQDLHSEAWFLFLATSRWFAVRLDLLCAFFLTAVSMCSVFAADSLSGGLVGLTLTYAMALMGLFQWGVRQSAEVENQMTSVERVFEYTELPPEAPLESGDHKPPHDWPQHGIITGENVCFRYSSDGAFVLKNLRFCFRAREKLGVCGRTGAGKSSLMAMLFRLAEPEGMIRIDGLDISTLGLHDLRKVISIIPQDPMLFNGTVRKNLDPFDEHTDTSLWNALSEVELKSAIEDLTGQLECMVDEGGNNFSVGQRQLLCLARAILKQNKILIIDEATANVDPRTDSLIQETIRKKFEQCTVLTIAHRLHTIMDSDRILVLNEGIIVEFDEPYRLLQDTNGYFSKMVEQTGATESANLLQLAKNHFIDQHGDSQSVFDNLLSMPSNSDAPRAS